MQIDVGMKEREKKLKKNEKCACNLQKQFVDWPDICVAKQHLVECINKKKRLVSCQVENL